MPATQISFADFAASLLASAQSEFDFSDAPCTPSVEQAAAAVVAHPVTVDGGECIQPCADWSEFDRLCDLADATMCIPYADWSRGGYVLAALANCLTPTMQGSRVLVDRIASLRFHAAECIGHGC